MPGLFQDTYQDCPSVLLFEAKGSSATVRTKVEWKFEGQRTNSPKVEWDPVLCSNVVCLENNSPKSQMTLTHKQGLHLRQRCLCVQTLVKDGEQFGMDLHVTDVNGEKHKLYLSTTYRETTVLGHYLHSKVPVRFKRPGHWTSLCMDFNFLIPTLFKKTSYHTLDGISVRGACAIKRIFTLRDRPPDDFGDNSHLDCPGGIVPIPRELEINCRSGSAAVIQHVNLTLRTGSGSSTDSMGKNPASLDRPHIAFGSRFDREGRTPKKLVSASSKRSQLDQQPASMEGLLVSSPSTQAAVSNSADAVRVNGAASSQPGALRSDGEIWASPKRHVARTRPTNIIGALDLLSASDDEDNPLACSLSITQIDANPRPKATAQRPALRTQEGSPTASMSLYLNRGTRNSQNKRTATAAVQSGKPGDGSVALAGGNTLGGARNEMTAVPAEVPKAERRSRMESLSRQGFTFQYQSAPVGIVGNKPKQRLATLRSFSSNHSEKVGSATTANDTSTPTGNGDSDMPEVPGSQLLAEQCHSGESDASCGLISVSQLEEHDRMMQQLSGKSRAKKWTEDMQLNLPDVQGTISEALEPSPSASALPLLPNDTLIGQDGQYKLPDFPSRNTHSVASSAMMSWLESSESVLVGQPLTSSERSYFAPDPDASKPDGGGELFMVAENRASRMSSMASCDEPSMSFDQDEEDELDVVGDLGDTWDTKQLRNATKGTRPASSFSEVGDQELLGTVSDNEDEPAAGDSLVVPEKERNALWDERCTPDGDHHELDLGADGAEELLRPLARAPATPGDISPDIKSLLSRSSSSTFGVDLLPPVTFYRQSLTGSGSPAGDSTSKSSSVKLLGECDSGDDDMD